MIKAIAIVMAHTYQPVSPTVPGVDIPELLLGHFRNTYMHHTIYSPKIDRARATNFLNYRSLVNNILVTCAFKIMTLYICIGKVPSMVILVPSPLREARLSYRHNKEDCQLTRNGSRTFDPYISSSAEQWQEETKLQ